MMKEMINFQPMWKKLAKLATASICTGSLPWYENFNILEKLLDA